MCLLTSLYHFWSRIWSWSCSVSWFKIKKKSKIWQTVPLMWWHHHRLAHWGWKDKWVETKDIIYLADLGEKNIAQSHSHSHHQFCLKNRESCSLNLFEQWKKLRVLAFSRKKDKLTHKRKLVTQQSSFSGFWCACSRIGRSGLGKPN